MKPAATALVAGFLFVWAVLTAAWAPPPSVAPVLMQQAPDGETTIGRASVPPVPATIATQPVPRPVGRAPLGTYVPAPSRPPSHTGEAPPATHGSVAAACTGDRRDHGRGHRPGKADGRPGCPAKRAVRGR